jgi:hypothetical protein
MKFAKKTSVASDSRKAFLKKGIFVLSLLLLTLFALPAIFLMKGQERDKQKKQPPIAEYAAEISRNESNFTGCSQKGRGEIKELSPDVEMLPVTSHWWTGLSALPVAQSDVIIMGEITNAQAHLSSDKTNVFSEFTLRVEEILKQNQKNLSVNDSIVVVRCGGGLKLSSNKTQYYRTAHQGFPSAGSRYVLFLANKSERLSILTGYELTEAGVMPLDKEEDEGQKTKLPFSIYQDVSVDTFLNDLRKAIISTKEKREGGQQ